MAARRNILALHYPQAQRRNQKVGLHYSAFPRKCASTVEDNQKLEKGRAFGAASISVESAKSG
jgi:hypothetical protein